MKRYFWYWYIWTTQDVMQLCVCLTDFLFRPREPFAVSEESA